MSDTCVVVMPVYNEAECIEFACREWLKELSPHGFTLLVIDDGSTDRTAIRVNRIAAVNPALRIVYQSHRGAASALLAGYREAIRTGCDWVFQVSGDAQCRAADFEQLWSRRHASPFILGNRVIRQDSLLRRILSVLRRQFLKFRFRSTALDPSVPLRLMRTTELAHLLTHLPEEPVAPNVLLAVLAGRAGYPPLNIPVLHRRPSSWDRRRRRMGLRQIFRSAQDSFAELSRFRQQEFRRFAATHSPAAVTLRKPAEAGTAIHAFRAEGE